MKSILRQMGLAALFFCGVYCLLYVITLHIAPLNRHIDVWSFHLQGGKPDDLHYYLCADSSRLSGSNKAKLIITGSSNSGLGFRPEHLQNLFPEYQVANLSVPNATASDMRQVLELALMLTPQEAREESIFVVGLWYNSVYGNRKKTHKSVNEVLVESGLYKWHSDSVRPIIRPSLLHKLVRALHPYFILQRIWQGHIADFSVKDILAFGDRPIQNKPGKPCIPGKVIYGVLGIPYSDPMTEEQKQWQVDWFGGQCDFGDDDGLYELLAMCRLIHTYGGRVVFVDMPLARWHQERSAAFQEYQKRRKAFFEEMSDLAGAYYIDLLSASELSDEENSFDGIHPRLKPESLQLWSRTLKEKFPPELSDTGL